jgi:hypothetical protein
MMLVMEVSLLTKKYAGHTGLGYRQQWPGIMPVACHSFRSTTHHFLTIKMTEYGY